MHWFLKFILAWTSTYFGQCLSPSSGVYSLYTHQWYMSYRFVDSFWAGQGWSCSKAVYKPVWHVPLLSVQWINCWWWTDEISEACRFSWQNKFLEFVHLVGFITKKFVYHLQFLIYIVSKTRPMIERCFSYCVELNSRFYLSVKFCCLAKHFKMAIVQKNSTY